jgi:nucleoside phosphorylase
VICVIVALKKEIDFFLDMLGGLQKRREGALSLYEGVLARRPVRVIRTGVGRVSIDPGLSRDCSLLVSAGFCGALSPFLVRGDFVVSTSVVTHPVLGVTSIGARPTGRKVEKKIAVSSGTRKSLERAASACGAVLRFGTTLTAGRVVRTVEEKAGLHEACGALSVEMEDSHRLECAERRGLPFLSLRVVLDEQSDRIPSLRSAIRIPADTFDLLKGVNLCARALASLLARFVEKFEME